MPYSVWTQPSGTPLDGLGGWVYPLNAPIGAPAASSRRRTSTRSTSASSAVAPIGQVGLFTDADGPVRGLQRGGARRDGPQPVGAVRLERRSASTSRSSATSAAARGGRGSTTTLPPPGRRSAPWPCPAAGGSWPRPASPPCPGWGRRPALRPLPARRRALLPALRLRRRHRQRRHPRPRPASGAGDCAAGDLDGRPLDPLPAGRPAAPRQPARRRRAGGRGRAVPSWGERARSRRDGRRRRHRPRRRAEPSARARSCPRSTTATSRAGRPGPRCSGSATAWCPTSPSSSASPAPARRRRSCAWPGWSASSAGAVSMAAGEYVSMTAQAELLERELEMERIELRRSPEMETAELAAIYMARGVDRKTAEEMSSQLMRNPELALETHAREELGIDPERARVAAWRRRCRRSSASGWAPSCPCSPGSSAGGRPRSWPRSSWAPSPPSLVGGLLGRFTGRRVLRSAARQLLFTAVPAADHLRAGLLGRGGRGRLTADRLVSRRPRSSPT